MQVTELVEQIKRLNTNIELDIKLRSSWKLALRNGLLAAIGGILGMSIILSVVVKLAQPLRQIAALRPALEQLAADQSRRSNR